MKQSLRSWGWAGLLLIASLSAANEPAAVLAAASGVVTTSAGVALKIGDPVAAGDLLKVAGGDAVIAFSDGTKVRVEDGGSVKVAEKSATATALTLLTGKLQAWVKLGKGRSFRVRSGAAVASVRGTILGASRTGFSLFRGSLSITDDRGRNIILNGPQFVNLTGAGLGDSGNLPPDTNVPGEPNVPLPGNPAPLPGGVPKLPEDEAPESLPAGAQNTTSPIQESNSAKTCTGTVSPSSPCP